MKEYEYKSIIADEHAFRLILLYPGSKPKIEIEIIHASLDEQTLMPYEAVSYVWGQTDMCASVFVKDPKNSRPGIDPGPWQESVLETSLKVTNSLELVLRDLRHIDTKRCLWIDAICINQNDRNDEQLREKNHQVNLMDKVYNRAERVLFHLGRPTGMTAILKDTLTHLQEHQDSRRTTGMKMPQALAREHQDSSMVPEKQRLQGLERELEQKLQTLEELEELPQTIEVQEEVWQNLQELQELQEELSNVDRPQEPSEIQNPQQPGNSGVRDISDSDWEQVSGKLVGDYNNFHDHIRQSMEHILARPWFRRVWIIQEVANSRGALIYWGPISLSVRWFVDLARRLDIHMDTHQKAILDMMPRSRRDKLESSSEQDLYSLLIRFKEAQASREHDKIFALLGMCKSGKGLGTIAIDYSRSLECVIRDTIANIAHCDKSDVPDEFNMINLFTARLSSLLEDLVADFAINTKVAALRSLLLNRGDQITITPEMIERVVDRGAGREATAILLDHGRGEVPVPAISLEQAYLRDDNELAEIILAHREYRTPATPGATQATIPMADNRNPNKSQLSRLNRAVLACPIDGGGRMEATYMGAQRECASIPLSKVAVEGKHKFISLLLDYGADIEARNMEGQTALLLAALCGRWEAAKILLAHGADIEAKDENGRTPLSMAASLGYGRILSLGRSSIGAVIVRQQKKERYKEQFKYGVHDFAILRVRSRTTKDNPSYVAILELFLDKGAQINSVDNGQQTALWWAVNVGNSSAVEKLLNRKADTRNLLNGQMSLLSWAIWNGHEEIIALLSANDVRDGVVPTDDTLMWAIRAGNNSVLEALLDRRGIFLATPRADDGSLREESNDIIGIPLPDEDVTTSLFSVVAKEDNADALCILLERNLLPKSTLLISRSIFLAASTGHEKFVDMLVEAGGDVNAKNFEGKTPLLQAVEKGNRNMVRLLLAKGSDPKIPDSASITPLAYAARMGYIAIVKDLIEGGASVNTIHSNTDTALGEAAGLGHRDITRLLLDKGAHVDKCGSAGVTPLMRACYNGKKAAVQLLLDANADINIRDRNGKTAVEWARLRFQVEVLQILEARLSENP